MARVHCVMNQKGGVGKSLITVNLTAVTSDVLGRREDDSPRVVAVSVDPQGTVPWRAERIRRNGPVPFDYINAAEASPEALGNLRNHPASNVFVDTIGWLPLTESQKAAGEDPLGEGRAADILRILLDQADDVIVPITTEMDSWEPTWTTIEQVIKPRGIPYTVVINNWSPSEGKVYVKVTREFCAQYGWNVASTVIRRYRCHTNSGFEGRVVTQYGNTKWEVQGRMDFYRFALEHGLKGAAGPIGELTRLIEPREETVFSLPASAMAGER